MEPKDDKVKVKEETQKIKRVIKLGKIVEENVGSMTNNYEGTQIGGSNPNQVILFYENKHFWAYPVNKSFSFKKEIINIDESVQKELMNFSNDLEYSVKKAQARKAENKGTKKVEEFSEQARRETGLEEVEEHNKKLRITSLLKKKNEIKNKEEADFNEDDEVFQDNDDNDKYT